MCPVSRPPDHNVALSGSRFIANKVPVSAVKVGETRLLLRYGDGKTFVPVASRCQMRSVHATKTCPSVRTRTAKQGPPSPEAKSGSWVFVQTLKRLTRLPSDV